MNNLKKIGLTALAGALVSVSANAAELTVTGGAALNLYGEEGKDTGNGFTMTDGITFAASAEMDNGWNVTVTQIIDSSDGTNGAIMDTRKMAIDMGDNGTFTFYGDGGSSVSSAKDDTTPTAGEEAWGDVTGATAALSGGATNNMMYYSNSSLMDGVTVDVSYVPSGAGQAEGSIDYGVSYTGIDGLTIGIVEGENTATAGAHTDTTILYANYAMDSITVGFTSSEQDSETANSDIDFSAMGISYAASEELSVSLNSSTHDYELATKSDQEAFGISVSYVMGSMTLSANHNTVDNAAGTASDDRSGYNLALAFAF